jgi:hypothetical protein
MEQIELGRIQCSPNGSDLRGKKRDHLSLGKPSLPHSTDHASTVAEALQTRGQEVPETPNGQPTIALPPLRAGVVRSKHDDLMATVR